MSFCTITPTRGDRPQFLEFCKHQISRMTVKPDHSYFIDWPPVSKEIDLIPRVRAGIAQAIEDGFDQVFILEDDDYYFPNYFETMQLGKFDFIGSETSWYYNLKDNRYSKISHPGRSSLFTTGFKVSALKNFNWPEKNVAQLDISLWNHAQQYKRKFVPSQAVGIKHGIGLCAGTGHFRELKEADPERTWLKSVVDAEAYIFYKTVL